MGATTPSTRLVDVGDAVPLCSNGRARALLPPNDVSVVVLPTKHGFVALPDRCPHLGRSLLDANVRGNNVRCAGHGRQYRLAPGPCPGSLLAQRTQTALASYRAFIVDGRILVEVPVDMRLPSDREAVDTTIGPCA